MNSSMGPNPLRFLTQVSRPNGGSTPIIGRPVAPPSPTNLPLLRPAMTSPGGPVIRAPTLIRPANPFRPSPVSTTMPVIGPSITRPVLLPAVPAVQPARQPYVSPPAPAAPTPTPEEAIVDMKTEGRSPTLTSKSKGRGASIAVGAGAGFLVGNVPGAIIGAIIGSMMGKESPPPPLTTAGFDGLSFKRIVSSVTNAVSAVARPFDITSSRSFMGRLPFVGQTITSLSRQAVASSLVGVTGGAALFVRPSLAKPAVQGFMTGALIGSAIAGTSLPIPKASASPSAPASQQVIETSALPSGADMTVASIEKPPGAKSGIAPIVAGAGGGFLIAGPIGAIVGGIAGMIIGRRG